MFSEQVADDGQAIKPGQPDWSYCTSLSISPPITKVAPSGTMTFVVTSDVLACGMSVDNGAAAALGMDFHADHAVGGNERANSQQRADIHELDLLRGADDGLTDRAIAQTIA